MWPSLEPSLELLRLAHQQSGVLTREQVLGVDRSLAMMRRLVASGSWRSVAPGVVAVHSGPLTFVARAWTGVLLGGEGAALDARAALHLYGLVDEPELIDVAVPYPRIRRDHPPWRFHRRLRVEPRSNPPRVSVEEATLALCRSEPERIEGWLSTAIQRQRTTPGRLLATLNAYQRHPFRKAISATLIEVADGAQSPLEIDFLRDVERAHGLPKARRQRRRGRRITDAEYLGGLVIVELDGRMGHESWGQFRDMERDNCHTVLGSYTLRYGYRDVRTRPCEMAAQIAELLTRLGWAGQPTRCRRCRGTTRA